MKRDIALTLPVLFAMAIAAEPAYAQGPPVLPTDLTGIGVGSPGFPNLQMQLDSMKVGKSARPGANTQRRTGVNAQTQYKQRAVKSVSGSLMYRDPATGQFYLIPRKTTPN